MNNPTLQADWDALRLTLFRDVAETEHVNGEEWNNFLDVLTTAFDYKAPIYTIYRPLRTFAVARWPCLLYTSPSPRDKRQSRMPSSA